ncbi:MAG: winged helix-turn-helix transcriptional regulator [Vampirovibrionales bacterium]|nr:winged helix-turn-helix transcriptional regulator [Vampirovibrionales bacterium]
MTNAHSISYHDAGVSALWVVGLTMTEIAHVLDISPRVVEHRIARMRERGILAGSLRRWSLAEGGFAPHDGGDWPHRRGDGG